MQLLAFVPLLALVGATDGAGRLDFLTSIKEKIGEARALNCKGRRCKFNVQNLKLDGDGSIRLSVKAKGRQILCQRTPTQRKKNWYGSCDGDAGDANFVKRTDPQGVEHVYGSVTVGDEICHIAPNAQGEEEVTCRSASEFKDDKPPIRITRALRERNEQAIKEDYVVGFSPSVGSTSLRGRNNHGRRLFDDSGTTIDIMFVWTKDAECANSNLPKGCTLTNMTDTNMRGRVQLAVAETNTAFTLSGAYTQLRLVHAYRDPDYDEPENGNDQFKTSQDLTLDRLSSKDDGQLDSVHAKRALYGADMVQILVAGKGYCGLAYGGPDIHFSFSLAHFSCSTGYFSTGHELVHQWSGNHDRGVTGQCDKSVHSGYNYGYRNPNATFRTILALECNVGHCDKPAANACTRVQRFSSSNTSFSYNGLPIGDAYNDNARVINAQRATVASFFPAMNCQNDKECNDKDPWTIDTCNVANSACVFTPTTVAVPSPAPTLRPTKAPTKVPTKVPTKAPTKAPVSATPTLAPAKTPTNAPVPVPLAAPIPVPLAAPVPVPTPVAAAVPAFVPTTAPRAVPVSQGTGAPVRTPISVPVLPPSPVAVRATESPVVALAGGGDVVATKRPVATVANPPPTSTPLNRAPVRAPAGAPTKKPRRPLLGRLFRLFLGK